MAETDFKNPLDNPVRRISEAARKKAADDAAAAKKKREAERKAAEAKKKAAEEEAARKEEEEKKRSSVVIAQNQLNWPDEMILRAYGEKGLEAARRQRAELQKEKEKETPAPKKSETPAPGRVSTLESQVPASLALRVTSASTGVVGTLTPAQQALAGGKQTIAYPTNFANYDAVLIERADGYEKGKGPLLSYGKQNTYVSKAEAQQLLYTMNDDARKELSRLATSMGVAESTAWNVAVEAAASKLMNGTNVTPLEALNQYVQQGIDSGQFSRGGAKTTSWTNRQLQLTNADDARVIIDSALSQYLGRNATEKERKAFLTALNAQEQAKPTVSSGTTTTGVSGSTSQTSKTTGGFGDAARAQFAEDWARAQEGAAEHEFANRGVKLLLDSLAPIVKLGGV